MAWGRAEDPPRWRGSVGAVLVEEVVDAFGEGGDLDDVACGDAQLLRPAVVHPGIDSLRGHAAAALHACAPRGDDGAVAAILEGSRPLLVEVQALVAPAAMGPPRPSV